MKSLDTPNIKGLDAPEISKLASRIWHAGPDLRDHYKQLAEEAAVEHRSRFPDYKYRPRKKGELSTARKRRRTGNTAKTVRGSQSCAVAHPDPLPAASTHTNPYWVWSNTPIGLAVGPSVNDQAPRVDDACFNEIQPYPIPIDMTSSVSASAVGDLLQYSQQDEMFTQAWYQVPAQMNNEWMHLKDAPWDNLMPKIQPSRQFLAYQIQHEDNLGGNFTPGSQPSDLPMTYEIQHGDISGDSLILGAQTNGFPTAYPFLASMAFQHIEQGIDIGVEEILYPGACENNEGGWLNNYEGNGNSSNIFP
ncbi:hypothetical protein CVT26_013488 [Gymnopilus dilepis]|uniref:HMG box domain-containing protein n=1 Tax=Gymnopilus dilepis TaxID=231916 RepID=A0A409YWQ6_9AGAR|nr:hypothetical protein CVT26_013488 [Gymnopilus dilepis]